MTARGRISLPPSAPLEKRVAALEDEIWQISGSLHQTQHNLEEEARARGGADDFENHERKAEDEKTRKQLREAVAGGLHLEMMGVCWLFVGVILLSASAEISRMFQ